MCGRYATTRSEADLSLLFDATSVTEALGPSWNVAPTDPVPLVRMSQRHGDRVVDSARWGLVPPWADDPRTGARMINARAETVATSRAFASSFERRRCLVPADGWFEWVRDGKTKRAFYMTPRDSSVLAFAGIWTMWRERWSQWLAGGGDAPALLEPMSPAELEAIEVRPVRPDVGNVRNNGPHLLTAPEPVTPAEVTLF
jgi:putative SOS response-associated peptidase YedK